MLISLFCLALLFACIYDFHEISKLFFFKLLFYFTDPDVFLFFFLFLFYLGVFFLKFFNAFNFLDPFIFHFADIILFFTFCSFSLHLIFPCFLFSVSKQAIKHEIKPIMLS